MHAAAIGARDLGQAKREDTVWREDKKRGRLTLRATPAASKALGIDETSDEAETPADADTKPARSGKSGKSKARGTRADSSPRTACSPGGVAGTSGWPCITRGIQPRSTSRAWREPPSSSKGVASQ